MKDGVVFAWKAITGDLTPDERKVLGKVLFTASWRAVLVFHVAWACGWLAVTGIGGGFAKADEIDKKIEKATKPLAAQIEAQNRLVAIIGEQVSDQVANSVATEIRYLVGKKCKETDVTERDRLQREIDRKQAEYRKIRSEWYPFGCGDV